MAKKTARRRSSRQRHSTAGTIMPDAPDLSKPLVGVPVLQGEVVGLDVGVDKDDILALAMSQAEDLCQENINRCRAEVKVLEAECGTIGEAVTAKSRVVVAGFAAAAAAKFVDAFKALGFDPEVEVQLDRAPNDPDNTDAQGSVTVGMKSRNTNPEARIQFSCKTPAAVKKLLEKRGGLQKQAAALRDEQFTWRKKLDNLDSYERKAKGKLAAARLNTSEEGRQVLTMLTGTVERDIKLLAVDN